MEGLRSPKNYPTTGTGVKPRVALVCVTPPRTCPTIEAEEHDEEKNQQDAPEKPRFLAVEVVPHGYCNACPDMASSRSRRYRAIPSCIDLVPKLRS